MVLGKHNDYGYVSLALALMLFVDAPIRSTAMDANKCKEASMEVSFAQTDDLVPLLLNHTFPTTPAIAC
jgi:hypothetical protein